MKPFRFGLARVLSLKETQENQARLELASVIRAIGEQEDLQRSLRAEQAKSRKSIDEDLAVPGRIRLLTAHIDALERRYEQAEVRKAELHAERVRREQAYWDARRERRMLEALRDRKRAEHDREQARKEAGEYDAFVQFLLLQAREEREDGSHG